ncbi:MAG: beta-ketoacyl-ACP reductase [Saprospiraceae bacterium]|nr:beta-ketoacyl-ACP reductase [Saprospiraceae bacterium]
MRLKDKVAIVTGGANGIGRATVERFASEGAKVVIWDIQEAAGQELTKSLLGKGRTVKFQNVNTVKSDQTEKAVEAIIEEFGQIDILINNAGITRDAMFKKMSSEFWQQVLDVNLTGVFNSTKAVYPHMAERKYGRIVTASSVVGLYGNMGQTNYAATKAGVIAMTQVWAKEFGRYNITANAVAPGFIHTEMMDTIPQEILQKLKDKTPLGRLGQAEEVAALYAFLASDEAAYISGAVFSIDGGVTL